MPWVEIFCPVGTVKVSNNLQCRAGELEELEDAFEVVVAVVFDLDLAFFGGVIDGDVGGEVLLKAFCELTDVDIDFFGCCFFCVGFAGGVGEEGLGEFLCCADGEFTADDLVGGEFLGVGIFQC